MWLVYFFAANQLRHIAVQFLQLELHANSFMKCVSVINKIVNVCLAQNAVKLYLIFFFYSFSLFQVSTSKEHISEKQRWWAKKDQGKLIFLSSQK